MGRKKEGRFIDDLQRRSKEQCRRRAIEAKAKGAPCIYPVSPAEVGEFSKGICKYRERTGSYNQIKKAYEDSEAMLLDQGECDAALNKMDQAIRESVVQSLMSNAGKGWPMPVLWWILYTHVYAYNDIDISRDPAQGISVKAAIDRFLGEFRQELDIFRPEAKPGSIRRAFDRVTVAEWEEWYQKVRALHEIKPSDYTRAILHYLPF